MIPPVQTTSAPQHTPAITPTLIGLREDAVSWSSQLLKAVKQYNHVTRNEILIDFLRSLNIDYDTDPSPEQQRTRVHRSRPLSSIMEMSPAPPIHESDGGDSFGVPSPMPVSPPTQLGSPEENMVSDQPQQSPGEQLSPQVEEASIQQGMEQNKESLKRKLLLRRSVNELVDQGIYPPLKTPPAYAEQRKHLQRAQTGDLLKHKIQCRPDRSSLVQQHILEDTNIAPSLVDAQRQLKRARLVDSLGDRIANRPGPLELVEGNILHTDPEIEEAIKEGKLCYDKSEGDDDSSLCSDETPSPSSFTSLPPKSFTTKTGINTFSATSSSKMYNCPPPPDIQPLLQKLKQQQTSISTALSAASVVTVSTASLGTNKPFTFSSGHLPLKSIAGVNVTSPPSIASFSSTSSKSSKSARSKKLAKQKANLSKNKTIKFHEYKGPPSVSKANKDEEDETPYHTLLQQQQLFLQWQLEVQKTGGSTTNILPVNVPFAISGQKLLTSTGTNMSTTSIPTAQIIAQAPPTSGAITPALTPGITPTMTPALTTVISPQSAIAAPTLGSLGGPVVASAAPIVTQGMAGTVTKFTAVRHVTPPTGIVRPQKMLTTTSRAAPTGTFTIQKHVSGIIPGVIPGSKHLTPVHLQVHPTTPQPPPAPPLPPPNKALSVQPRAKCLEDMKVAELKVELKKRNLTVSGSKPQLIEKLRPYVDSIFGTSKSVTCTTTSIQTVSSGSSISSPGSSICGPPSNNPSIASPSSVKSVSSFGSVINIQPISPQSVGGADELILSSGMISSPPLSPMSALAPGSTITAVAANSSAILSNPNGNISSLDLNNSYSSLPSVSGYSPSDSNSMDVPSPPTLTLVTQSALSSSSGNIQSMLVDPHSRPPSVAPMDIEATPSSVTPPLAPPLPTPMMGKKKKQQIVTGVPQVLVPMSMGLGQPAVFSCASSGFQAATVVGKSRIMNSPQQVYTTTQTPGKLVGQPVQPPQMRTVMPQQHVTQQVTQQVTQHIQNPQITPAEPIQSPASNQSLDSNEDPDSLVLKQQIQIEELQRKLDQSRLELQQAQQAQQHAQQQKQAIAYTMTGQTPIVGPNGEVPQLQDIVHHPPLTQPTPVMSQIQLHGPASSPPTPVPQLTSSDATNPVTSVTSPLRQQAMMSQAHLFIQPSPNAITSVNGGVNGGVNCSAVVKQTLANFLLQNGSAQKVHAGSVGSTSQTSTTTQSSTTNSKKKNGKNKNKNSQPNNNNNVTSTTQPSSVPSSPVNNKLHRSSTNPFFSPTTDPSPYSQPPPKYDEAIKQQNLFLQQQVLNNAAKQTVTMKTHTVDDVLEILIANGELPASLADEDSITCKTEGDGSMVSMVDPGGEMNIPMLGGTSQLTNNMHTTNHLTTNHLTTNHLTRPYTIPTYNDSGQLTYSLTNDMVKDMASLNPQDVSVDTKDATLTNGNIIGITDTGSLLDSPLSAVDTDNLANSLSDNLQNIHDLPFIEQSMMEWSESDLLNNLDALDQSVNLKIKQEDVSKIEDIFPLDNTDTTTHHVALSGSAVTSPHNVSSVSACSDTSNVTTTDHVSTALPHVDSNTMNMDVSDWLDVMMPNHETSGNYTHTTDQLHTTNVTDFSSVLQNGETSGTNVSNAANAGFQSNNTLLTPKNEDMLELFGMDESDLYSTPELASGIGFEKPLETSTAN